MKSEAGTSGAVKDTVLSPCRCQDIEVDGMDDGCGAGSSKVVAQLALIMSVCMMKRSEHEELPLPAVSAEQLDTFENQSKKMVEDLEKKSGKLDPNLLEVTWYKLDN